MAAIAFPRVEVVDLNGAPGRALVVGDIHGCFDALEEALAGVAFDPAVDTLFLLGDLIDRGPQSAAAADWLHWPRVRGNHEDLAWRAVIGDAADRDMHRFNGGEWFDALANPAQHRLAAALMDAPLAIELVTPAGRRIGLVHADVDGDDWPAFTAALADHDDDRAEQVAIWSRRRIGHAEAGMIPSIAGIDHVFFGHNMVRKVLDAGNCSWIDTGAGWPGGRPTVIDIDAHLDAIAARRRGHAAAAP